MGRDETTIRNKKVLYFADPMFTMGVETIEQECEESVIEELYLHDLEFEKIECWEQPPFGQTNYDILFFDYGGMSMGNDMLGSLCRQILREAKDYPSRYYVMVSSFTMRAMKDEMKDYLGSSELRCLSNIYLSIKDFVEAFKKYES